MISTPRRIFQVMSSPPPPSSTPTPSDYGMWSLHVPAVFQAQAPAHSVSPPMTVHNSDTNGESTVAASSAAAATGSLVFDARSLVVKREPVPPVPLLIGDAGGPNSSQVHGGSTTTVLRRGGSAASAFGFVDVQQQALPPSAAAIYHPFGPEPPPSPRLWTSTESITTDDYDLSGESVITLYMVS